MPDPGFDISVLLVPFLWLLAYAIGGLILVIFLVPGTDDDGERERQATKGAE